MKKLSDRHLKFLQTVGPERYVGKRFIFDAPSVTGERTVVVDRKMAEDIARPLRIIANKLLE